MDSYQTISFKIDNRGFVMSVRLFQDDIDDDNYDDNDGTTIVIQ